jgi:hypothetical protein
MVDLGRMVEVEVEPVQFDRFAQDFRFSSFFEKYVDRSKSIDKFFPTPKIIKL